MESWQDNAKGRPGIRHPDEPVALMAALVIETTEPVTEEALDLILMLVGRSLDGWDFGSVEFMSTPEPTEYRDDDDYDVRPVA